MVTRYHADKVDEHIEGVLVLFSDYAELLGELVEVQAILVEAQLENEALRTQLSNSEERVKHAAAEIERVQEAHGRYVTMTTQHREALQLERNELSEKLKAVRDVVDVVSPPAPRAALRAVIDEFVAKLRTVDA